MKRVPFEPWHLAVMNVQPQQRSAMEYMVEPVRVALAQGFAFTLLDENNVPLICSGVSTAWPGRGELWAFLADDLGARFVHVHAAALRFLEGLHFRRIEATVDEGFEEGERWVKMLGFRLETPCMKGYLPDGGNASMWVRGV